MYIVLDPRISYEGIKEDYESDPELLEHLESSKLRLHTYFLQNYAGAHSANSGSQDHELSQTSDTGKRASVKVSFTSRYQKKDRLVVNELEEYFKLAREDFDTCNPLEWWRGRRSQYPNLYRLVCDIFSIPGMVHTASFELCTVI